jgi:hypothetical protein
MDACLHAVSEIQKAGRFRISASNIGYVVIFLCCVHATILPVIQIALVEATAHREHFVLNKPLKTWKHDVLGLVERADRFIQGYHHVIHQILSMVIVP